MKAIPFRPELLDLVGVPQNPRFHPFDVWGHIWHALDHSDGSLTLGWAILLHDVGKGRKGVRGIRPDGMPSDHGHDKVGKAMAESILHRLGKRSLVNRVAFLVGNHMHFGPARFLPVCGTLALASEGSPQRGVPLYQGLAGSIPGIGDLCFRYGSHNGFGRKSGAGAPFCRSAFSDGRYYARPYSRPCHKRAGPYCCGNSAKSLKGCCPCFFPVFRTEIFPIPLKRSREQRTSGGKRKKKKDPRLNVSV